MPNISVYFDEDLAEQVKKIADKADRSFSYILRELVQEALEAREQEKQEKQTVSGFQDL
jgi:predicted transcriptional regulator